MRDSYQSEGCGEVRNGFLGSILGFLKFSGLKRTFLIGTMRIVVKI
jgi:hypothetical protein